MKLSRARTLVLTAVVASIWLVLLLFGRISMNSLGTYLVAGDGTIPTGDIILIRSYGLPNLDEFQGAARLFEQRKGSYVLVALHKPHAFQEILGHSASQEEAIAAFFAQNRIPRQSYSLVPVDDGEPVLIRDALTLRPILKMLSETRSWNRVILVGRQFRLRRVLWSFQTFAGQSSIRFLPYSVPLQGINTDGWWKSNVATSEVLSEYFKLFYFQIYRLGFNGLGFPSSAALNSSVAR